MLEIFVPAAKNVYDEKREIFFETKDCKLCLEHSLLSIKKWESRWHKPFLSKGYKTNAEMIDYIRCMTITKNVDPNVFLVIPEQEMKKISDYIKDPMTATVIYTTAKDGKISGKKKIVTAELIYYWMIQLNIPIEFQKWHFNQLMMLIEVIKVENDGGGKMSKNEILAQNKRLNAMRKNKR